AFRTLRIAARCLGRRPSRQPQIRDESNRRPLSCSELRALSKDRRATRDCAENAASFHGIRSPLPRADPLGGALLRATGEWGNTRREARRNLRRRGLRLRGATEGSLILHPLRGALPARGSQLP